MADLLTSAFQGRAGDRARETQFRRRLRERAAEAALPALGTLLALTALLPPAAGQVAVLAAVIAFGVPHGALDGELVRPLLRPRLGIAWFLVFALPYLGLSALTLLAWHWAPTATLAAFLGLSALHFGVEDAGLDGLGIAVRGGLPIALPTLLHPAATWAVFATVAGTTAAGPPLWLTAASCAWAILVPFWLARRWRDAAEAIVPAAAFVLLPPLTAFAIYFICFHAPAHMRGVVQDRRAPRVGSMRAAVLRSIPITLLTVAIGAALWPLVGAGRFDAHLLSLTLQCLAALTLPHMLLDAGRGLWQRDEQGRVGAA